MASRGTLVIRFIGDLREFDRSLKGMNKRLDSTGKSMTKGVTLPVLGLGAAAFAAARDFNAGMANIATLIPGNTERVLQLKGAIQELAVQTGQSTTDLSNGMYQVISAFGDTADSVKILEANAKAARAGLATTTDAINLTSAVTKAYGDTSAAAVGRVSDLALMTVRMGQTTFPELASSMGKVTPIAQSMGVTQKQLFATFATLTGVTGTAAEVSTQYRGVLAGLINPTKDMSDLLKAQGFESGKAALKQLGLVGTMKLVTDASKKTGKPITKYISSIEAVPAALALAGPQSKKYADALKGMQQAAGATNVAFAEATEGVNKQGFALDQAKQRGIVFLQQLGDGLAPAMTAFFEAAQPAVDVISRMATRFAEADPHTQKLIVSIALGAAALGPLLIVTSKVITAVRTVIPLFITQSVVQGKATTTAGPLTKAVAWMAKTFWTLVTAIGKAVWAVLSWTAQTIAAVARATAAAAVNIIRQVALWTLLGATALKQAARMALAWFIALGPIGWAIAAVVALVALIIANWDKVKRWTKATWDWVSAKTVAAWTWIKGAVGSAVGWVVGRVTGAWNSVKAGTSAAWNAITGKVVGAWNAIRSAVSRGGAAVLDYIRSFPSRVLNGLGNMGTLLYDKGADMVRGLWDGIKDMKDWLVAKLISFVKSAIPGPIAKALGISSPSKVVADIARWVPAGMVVGLDAGSRDVMRAAERMAMHAIPTMHPSMTLPPARPLSPTPGLAAMGAQASARPIQIDVHDESRNPVVTATETARHLAFEGLG